MKLCRRPAMLNQSERDPRTTVLSVLCTLLVLLLLAVLIFQIWIGQNFFIVDVEGSSMTDTISDGDLLYAEKHFTAERGDVVVIDVEHYGLFAKGTKRVIKRLIAKEGDCVKCEGGVVYLKRAGGEYQPLDEPYAKGRTYSFKEVQVGSGEIFFLGDNREDSKDARDVGCLKYQDITGVVPEWAIGIKGFSTGWESFRLSFWGGAQET